MKIEGKEIWNELIIFVLFFNVYVGERGKINSFSLFLEIRFLV